MIGDNSLDTRIGCDSWWAGRESQRERECKFRVLLKCWHLANIRKGKNSDMCHLTARQTLSTPKTKVGGHKDTYIAIVAVIKRTLYRAANMHNKTAK